MKRFFTRFFIGISLFFGLIFCCVVPPFQAPDEFNHFYRSWQITEGGLLGEKTADNRLGGSLPVSLIEISRPFQSLPFQSQNQVKFDTILSLLSYPLSEKNRVFVDFSNTAIYAPTAYLPQVFAIFVGKLLEIPPLSIFYLARLFTLIFWLSIVYLSIRIVPKAYQWLWTFLALLPSSLILHASTSADVVTNALSFLALAIFLDLMLTPSTLTPRIGYLEGIRYVIPQKTPQNLKLALLFASTLLVSLNKLAYAPFCLLILISNQENFGGVKHKHLFAASLLTANFGIVAWWALVIAPLHISYADYHPVYRIGQQLNEGVDPTAQVQFILHNPLTFSKITILSLLKTAPSTLIHFVGKFGWEKNYLPMWLILPLFLGLILRGVFFSNSSFQISSFKFQIPHFGVKTRLENSENTLNTTLNRPQKIGLLLVALLTTLFLAVTLYLIWCPVGHPFIENLAGKYFIPIAPLFFLALPDFSKKGHFQSSKWTKHFDLYFSILLVISLSWTVFLILERYYL